MGEITSKEFDVAAARRQTRKIARIQIAAERDEDFSPTWEYHTNAKALAHFQVRRDNLLDELAELQYKLKDYGVTFWTIT